MDDFFAFLVLGIIRGMVYAVIALGINLVYKGSRTLNLAQPFLGLFAAFVAWYLTGFGGIAGAPATVIPGIDNGPVFIRWIRYPLGLFLFDLGSRPRFIIAAVVALLVAMRIGMRIEHDLMRRLERAPRLVRMVATLAIAQGLLGLSILLFERTREQSSQLKQLPVLLPESFSFGVGPLPVTAADVQVLIVVPLLAVGAAVFFKRSKFGVAIRATAENKEAAQILGIPAGKVSTFTWTAAGFLAGIGAILIATQQQSLDSGSLGIGLLVRALAASLVGGLTSLPGAFVGGIVVGVTEFLIRGFTNTGGLAEIAFFGLVILVLVFRPGGIFGQRVRDSVEAALVPAIRDLPAKLRRHPVSDRFRWTAVAVGIMLASAISLATGSTTNFILTRVLEYGIVGIALTVLIGYAGQISLGHWALVGIGAFAAGNLYDFGPVPFVLMVPLAVGIGMLVSLVIGLPALRIRGPYLAVVTLAFAVAANELIFTWGAVARGSAGITITAPDWGWLDLDSGSNQPIFFLAFASFLLCAWVAHNFKHSRTGRGFFSLRENEKAAATFGVQLTRYRLLAFMLSGGMAALAGVIFGLRGGQVAARDFEPLTSLLLVAMVIIGGLGSITGALLGAFLMFGFPSLLQNALGGADWVAWVVSFVSAIALIVAIVWLRGGLAGLLLLPRDPIVLGLIWQEEDAVRTRPVSVGEPEAGLAGDGRRGSPEETGELEEVADGVADGRSGRRQGSSDASRGSSTTKKRGSTPSRRGSGSGSKGTPSRSSRSSSSRSKRGR